MKGLILCGYQGIGKSSLCNRPFSLSEPKNVIDLESSNFFTPGYERPENWYIIYAQIAKDLTEQGYMVFTSSHKVFRNYLNEIGEKFITISPALELKDVWIQKLRTRYKGEPSAKNNKALLNAEQMYEENIKDLQAEKFALVLDHENYNLVESISRYLRDNHRKLA